MILANDKPNPTLHLDEKTNVEAPFLDQLAGLGWDVICATLWRRVPAWAQAKLLANVYCAHCGAMVTITNYSGRIVEGDLLLTGLCARCGGVVARLIESE